MNKTTRLILIFSILIFVFGCREQSDKKQKSTRTVIAGSVKNMKVYPNTSEFTLTIRDFRGKSSTFRDSINNDGTFKIVFDLYVTQDIDVNPIVGKIIAHPGDSIYLNIDFKDIGNIHFGGDCQKSNQDLNKYLSSNYCVFEFDNQVTRKLGLTEYKSYCDSVKSEATNKSVEFVKEFNPSPDIKKWTKDFINIKYYQSMLNFPLMLSYKSKIGYNELSIPLGYYDFLKNIETDFSDSIINTGIYQLLNIYTATFAQMNIKDTALTKKSYVKVLMNELIEKHKNGFFKQILLGNFFYQNLNQNDIDFFEEYRTIFAEEIHDSFLKVPLNNYYNALKRDIKNPEILSDAILSKMDNALGKSIIDTILFQNLGKVIYIDFWATWCAPCKAEMPNSKKLKQKFTGKDIEFVYICLDSKEEQWKLNLSQLQLDGSQFFCNQEQSKSIRKGLGIIGIPHYVLVNKKGKITESGSYLRPMNSETIKKIETLLNEK